jgi:uncharacterized protein YnzC (UPF0291/DUF896 family)
MTEKIDAMVDELLSINRDKMDYLMSRNVLHLDSEGNDITGESIKDTQKTIDLLEKWAGLRDARR